MKTALITGIAGQDGSFLAKHLLDNGYKVYGATRRSASGSLWRLGFHGIQDKVEIVDFELTDQENVTNVIKKLQPDEFYNLAAMSFVGTSFSQPVSTQMINYIGVLYILEAIKNYSPKTKFYQASTSEMFGKIQEVPQKETTPFYPRSPYGIAKLAAHWSVVNYREGYNLFLCSGILFNHESELRGDEFVTKKITNYVARYKHDNKILPLELGNLDSKRDWGYAGDYVKAMHSMLQQEKADDFVIATGETHSVRDFVEKAFAAISVDIVWSNETADPVQEVGKNKDTDAVVVKINPQFFRPTEVDLLVGDASKAKEQLGWSAEVTIDELVTRMVNYGIETLNIT